MSKKGGYFHQTAQEVLIGLSVLTRYNNRMYRIDEILFDKNPQSTFDCQGEPMQVFLTNDLLMKITIE